ncbi:uncharacterized protein LOC119686157 [Teleopsis dalmanni]|uniref:uncharacterized protein LOC119686157 n=1 Tax=Teleopsis dalmanni TaxID=139649 RepID=UPI0018CFDB36|nr:uncharacterized protein LOC119686157 [Teleopsis dalmanni]
MKLEVKILIAFGIILFLCSNTALGWRSFNVLITSFPFKFNSDMIDVKIKIHNKTDETTLDVVFNVLEDINDIHLKYAIALEASEGNYTALLNRSVNMCNFLKQRSMEPVLRVIYENILKSGNFIKTCPIKRGIYSLHEYHADEEILPSYVPETNFIVDIKMDLPNGKMVFQGRLNGKIDKSKGFNNLKMFSLG